MAEMVQGQLYRVGMTCRSPGQVSQVELLAVGCSPTDMRDRISYLYDLSDFDSYRVDYVAKEQDRCVVTKIKTQVVDINDPDAVISRPEGSVGAWQTARNAEATMFTVVARCTCYAKSAAHATKKLAERLVSKSDSVQIAAEQVSAPSAFAAAKDQSMFARATFVRG